MNKKNDIKVRIKEINQCSFNLNQKSLPKEEIEIGKNLSIGIGFNFNVDFADNFFRFFTLIAYKTIGETEETVLNLETEILFELNNLKLAVKTKKDSDELDVNNEFLATLAGVAIGTTRGILAANTKGTPFAKYPLPILNPKQIIESINK